MKELIGKTVIAIEVDAENQHWLCFHTDRGPMTYWVEGDCCSESWWADITGLQVLWGRVVIGVQEIPLPSPIDDRGRQDVDQAYGVVITTDRGTVVLVFRNSSNGYYGGEISKAFEGRPEGDAVYLDEEYRRWEWSA